MNRKFLMLCCLVSFSLTGFTGKLNSIQERPVIIGNITGFKNGTKVFLTSIAEQKTYDSATIINNEFVLRGPHLNEPMIFFLDIGDDYTSLIIGNDSVRLEGDSSDLPFRLRITGSKVEDANQLLRALTNKLWDKRDQFVIQYQSFKIDDERRIPLRDSMSAIDSKLRAINIAFIKEHPASYAAVAISLRYVSNKIPREELAELFDLIDDEIKKSKYGQYIQNLLETSAPKAGEPFADFEAIDQKGKIVQLSSLKGKYILLDFTASYCGPCRQSAEELKEINKEYKKTLAIVSVSADVSKDVWLNYIKRDKVSWLSVWDGEGVTGGAVLKYNASRLPTFVLIGKDGKIIDTWEGYSTGSLKARLKKYGIAGL